MKIAHLAASSVLIAGLVGGVARAQVPPPEVPPSRVPPSQLPPAQQPPDKGPPVPAPPGQQPPAQLPPPKSARPAEKIKSTSISVASVLRRLHRANQTEIEAGRIATANAGSKAVRAYGEHLMKDHRAADAKIVALAKKKDIDLVSEDALAQDERREQAEMLARIRALKGHEFDREFLNSMVTAHDQAISLIVSAQESVTDADARALLADLLPTVKEHRKTAADLLERTSGS
ncbi:MAG TPA: DUF4142 domain-containing protein [Polyangia bacterium]|nr:DUF4142 domain-containing protein [Polyangia bacterium]